MKCGLCRRYTRVEPLPSGWKRYRSLVFCPECRRQRFRLRFITMTVAEPIRDQWQEFRIALEGMWETCKPLLLMDQAWELTTSNGQHIVRVLVGDQWWALRLNDANWSRGRREAYEKIAAGEAAAGDFLLYPRLTHEALIQNRSSRDLRPYEIECKTVAWLPRERPIDCLFRAQTKLPNARIRNQIIEVIDVADVRRAICANWISFPSQVPTFPRCGPPHLQHKLIQLYFVMGWSCARIAARYQLRESLVRGVLDLWKSRAASAGYLQHIPSADAMRHLEMLALSVDRDSSEVSPGPGKFRSTGSEGRRPCTDKTFVLEPMRAVG